MSLREFTEKLITKKCQQTVDAYLPLINQSSNNTGGSLTGTITQVNSDGTVNAVADNINVTYKNLLACTTVPVGVGVRGLIFGSGCFYR